MGTRTRMRAAESVREEDYPARAGGAAEAAEISRLVDGCARATWNTLP